MKLTILMLGVLCALPLQAASKSDTLIQKIVSQLKIAEQFDADLRNLPTSVTAETREGREQIWLADIRVREMGWSKVKDLYSSELKSRFSEAELEALTARLDDPLIAKLVNAHLQSIKSLSDFRAQLFQSYWTRYNNMEFTPPDDVIHGNK